MKTFASCFHPQNDDVSSKVVVAGPSSHIEDRFLVSIGLGDNTVPGGALETISVALEPWGFSAVIEFALLLDRDEDPCFEVVKDPAPLPLVLTLTAKDEGATPWILRGWARTRAITEVLGSDAYGAKPAVRRYRLSSNDLADVTWREHHPTKVVANKKLREAIELERPEGVTLKYALSALEAPRPHVAWALGNQAASYYDWLCWILAQHSGHLCYDYSSDCYEIRSDKIVSTAVAMEAEWVGPSWRAHPQPPRWGPRLLGVHAEGPTTEVIPQPLAISGVQRDTLVTSPLPADLAEPRARAKNEVRPTGPHIYLLLQQLPSQPLYPWTMVTLPPPQPPWGNGLFRVIRVQLEGQLPEGVASDSEVDDVQLTLFLKVTLEDATDPTAHLPRFVAPRYPLYLEGKIKSVGGAPEDRTWLRLDDPAKPGPEQAVQVPLFGLELRVPFVPGQNSGRFFFPPDKDARVLLAIGLHEAKIARFLSWSAEVRPPEDGQGNRIWFGKRSTQGTVLAHGYEDGKVVLRLKRQFGKDTITTEWSEGRLYMEVKEDDTAEAAEPRFDVTPQQVLAGAEVRQESQTQLGVLSGAHGEAAGRTQTALGSARAELEQSLGSMEQGLGGQISETRAQIENSSSGLGQASARIDAVVSSTSATLTALLAGEDLLSPLVATENEVKAFVAETQAKVTTLRQDLDRLTVGLLAPISAAEGAIQKANVRLTALPKAAAGALAPMGPPPAGGPLHGPWQKLKALPAQADSAIAQARAKVAQARAQAQPLEQRILQLQQKLQTQRQGAQTALDQARQSTAATVPRVRVERAYQTSLASLAPFDAYQATLTTLAESATANASTFEVALNAADLSSLSAAAASARGLEAQGATTVQNLLAPAQGLLSQLQALPRATEPLSAALRAARSALGDAIERTLAPLGSTVTTLEALPQQAANTWLPPLSRARALASATESEIKRLVQQALISLESAAAAARQLLAPPIQAVQAAIAAAHEALDLLKSGLTQPREALMTVLDTLASTLSQLTSLFENLASTLEGLVNGALSALEAIPSEQLPKALVNPALQAIQQAVDAAMQQLATLVSQGQNGLNQMATQLVAAIDTARTQALETIAAFTETIRAQLQAVLPPIQSALTSAEQQLTAIASGFESSMSAATTTVAGQVQALRTQLSTRLQAATAPARAGLSAATTQRDNSLAAWPTSLSSARAGLQTQVTAQTAPIDAQLTTLNTQAETLANNFRQQLAVVGRTGPAALSALGAPVEAQLAGWEPQLDAVLAPARQTFELQQNTLGSNVDALERTWASLPTADQVVARYQGALAG